MIEEIWRPIPGYEGLYEVSSYGRVRSLDRFIVDSLGHRRFYKGKVLSPIKDKYGYLSVKLQKGNKHNIHRIVAQVFIENIDNLPQVNHKDENKSNNRVDNLEWCDQAYNNLYGTRLERLINTKIKNGYVNEEKTWKLWIGKIGSLSYDDDPYCDLETDKFSEAIVKSLDKTQDFIADVEEDPQNWVQYYKNI